MPLDDLNIGHAFNVQRLHALEKMVARRREKDCRKGGKALAGSSLGNEETRAEIPDVVLRACEVEYPERFFAALAFIQSLDTFPPTEVATCSSNNAVMLEAVMNRINMGPEPPQQPWAWTSQHEQLVWEAWSEMHDLEEHELMCIFVETVEQDNPRWYLLLTGGYQEDAMLEVELMATESALEFAQAEHYLTEANSKLEEILGLQTLSQAEFVCKELQANVLAEKIQLSKLTEEHPTCAEKTAYMAAKVSLLMLKSVLAEFPPEDEMDLRLQDAQQVLEVAKARKVVKEAALKQSCQEDDLLAMGANLDVQLCATVCKLDDISRMRREVEERWSAGLKTMSEMQQQHVEQMQMASQEETALLASQHDEEEEESTEVDSLDNQLGAVVSKLDEVSQYKRESEARWNENRRKVNEIQRQREAKAKAEAKHLSSQEKIANKLKEKYEPETKEFQTSAPRTQTNFLETLGYQFAQYVGLAEPEADVFPSTPSRSTTTQKDRNLAVDCKMEDEVDLNAKLPDVVILEYPYKGGILSESQLNRITLCEDDDIKTVHNKLATKLRAIGGMTTSLADGDVEGSAYTDAQVFAHKLWSSSGMSPVVNPDDEKHGDGSNGPPMGEEESVAVVGGSKATTRQLTDDERHMKELDEVTDMLITRIRGLGVK